MKAIHSSAARGHRLLALSILIILSAASARAIPIFGINDANGNLVRFESATPGTFVSSMAISGLVSGDTIVALDFRPLDSKLYGLGIGGRLYTIDPATAVATQVGTGTFAITLNGTAFGFDFNPVVDRIRVVTDANENLRVNPNDGTIVDGDPATAGIQRDSNLTYASGDPNQGDNPGIVACAYTNNAANATATTLFAIDADPTTNNNVLVRIGGINVPPGTPSPNGGQLFTVGALGVDPSSTLLGFDIAADGIAYATMLIGSPGIPRLYTINLNTGAATLVGTTGPAASPVTVRALAVAVSSYTSSLVGKVATFTGTVGANSIVFDQTGGLLRHNRFSNGDAGFSSDFDFNPGVANDQTLSATDPAVTIIVNSGDRDDQVTIGTAVAPAGGLAATFQINGQGGNDSLVINDASGTAARTIAVNGSTSTVSGFGGPISYGTLESVTVNAGTGADTVNISGVSAALTSITANGGADTVNFGDGASLSGGTLDGGVGRDTLAYTAYSTSVTVDLPEAGNVGPATGTGGISSFEDVTGGSTADVLTGNSGGNTLIGGPGGDQLFGDAGNDRLIWNNGDGSDFMEGGANSDIVEVNGSPSGDDQFLIQVNPADATRLRFDRTNLGLFNLNIGTTEGLDFNTLGGNDTTTVDFSGGNPIGTSTIDFDGGTGSDRLVLQRSAGNFVASSTDHVATGTGAGSVSVDGRTINYTGLEPVDDTVPSTNFTFTAPISAGRLSVLSGPTINGMATIQISDTGADLFELVNFAQKTNVTINTGTVGQIVAISAPVAPLDLNSLTINTSSANDEISILGVPPGVTTTVNSLDGVDQFNVLGLGVPSGTTLFLDASAAVDNLVYDADSAGVTTTAGPNPGQTSITRRNAGVVIYQNFENVTLLNLPPKALNIATRLRVLPGDNALIGGFIITGSVNKRVLMRAIGPSLGQFGLTGLLADPTLELFDSGSQLVGSNDNWRQLQETEISNSGLAPQNDSESALIATLSPGAHTVVVRGKNNSSGIGVVEVYDLEKDALAQLANISTRGFVDAGDNVMIGGFILGGSTLNTRIAVRGIGPSLTQVGITNALADPTLSLRDANGAQLVSNDNWMDDSAQAAELSANGLAPTRNEESGIFTTLPPGAFTAILAGKNGGIGVGLIEVYNLQ